jgi:hypothetical protein
MILPLLTNARREILPPGEVITISEGIPNAKTDAIGREASMEF